MAYPFPPVVFHDGLPCLLTDVRRDLAAAGVSRRGIDAYLRSAKPCHGWDDLAMFASVDAWLASGDACFADPAEGRKGDLDPDGKWRWISGHDVHIDKDGDIDGGGSPNLRKALAEKGLGNKEDKRAAGGEKKGADGGSAPSDKASDKPSDKASDKTETAWAAHAADKTNGAIKGVVNSNAWRPQTPEVVKSMVSGAASAVGDFMKSVGSSAGAGVKSLANSAAELTLHGTDMLSHLSTPITSGWKAVSSAIVGCGSSQMSDHEKNLRSQLGDTTAALVLAGGKIASTLAAGAAGLGAAAMLSQHGVGNAGIIIGGLAATNAVGLLAKHAPQLGEALSRVPGNLMMGGASLLMKGMKHVFGGKADEATKKADFAMLVYLYDEQLAYFAGKDEVCLPPAKIKMLSRKVHDSIARASLGALVHKGGDWLGRFCEEVQSKGKGKGKGKPGKSGKVGKGKAAPKK